MVILLMYFGSKEITIVIVISLFGSDYIIVY